jgi:hypothetical protein
LSDRVKAGKETTEVDVAMEMAGSLAARVRVAFGCSYEGYGSDVIRMHVIGTSGTSQETDRGAP